MTADASPAAPPGVPHGGATGQWRLRLLGDVVLTDRAGLTVRLPSRAAAALLARLAMAPNRAHAREELVELLWPGVALDVGRNRLRQVLSTLKSLLDGGQQEGAVVMADRQHLRLRADRLACDVPAFEAAVRAGHSKAARAIYQGELMPGSFDEWIVDERLRLAALAARVDDVPHGATAAAQDEADRGPAWTPGEQAERAAPGPAGPPAFAAPASAAPDARPAAPGRPALPRYLTFLHGAESSAANLCADICRHRLVTLVGPGGQGKTRLAVEAARGLGQGQGQGDTAFDLVTYVALVTVDSREGLLDAILLALRQEARGGDVIGQLAALLAERRALMVLDNFEQLVDAGAGAVAELLERTENLHVLATSRRVLGIDGERVFQMPSLALPEVDASDEAALRSPAVALFLDRARAVRADFHLSSRNREAVIGLVRLLQGMPLAIELAASRVRSMPPAQALAWLQTAQALPQDDAITLLARSGPRGGQDARHASMLAVVDWSWQLLTSEARGLLAELSVFAGGFTLEAAQAVATLGPRAVALALDELVAQSMLRSLDDGTRSEPFEVIRIFAAATLAPDSARLLRRRHRRWLIEWGGRLPRDAPQQALRGEMPNIAAAFATASADDAPGDAADLAQALQEPLGDMSLPPGALRALSRSAAQMPRTQRAITRGFLTRALVRAAQAEAAIAMADLAQADLAQVDPGPPAPRQAPGTEPGPDGEGAIAGAQRAQVLARIAHARWRLQRDAGVGPLLDEALALARAAGDRSLQASILATLGAVIRRQDPAAAIDLQRRSLALWQASGDVRGIDTGRANLAIALAQSRAECHEALALLDAVLADADRGGDWLQRAHASNVRGEALSRLGRWAEAAQAYRDCIRIAHGLAEMLPLAYGLWNLPRALAHLRRPHDAALLMAFAERFVPLHTGPLNASDRRDLHRVRRLCAAQAGRSELEAAWTTGSRMALRGAIAAALQD